jgi:small subunit ribosomal protein S4
MARYIGPVCRRCRYIGEKLMLKGEKCVTPKCPVEKRNVPPGEHSEARRRRISDRGIQLREKQKIRFSYGIMERQFRRFLAEATRAPGATPEGLLVLLERRLDNVIYCLGFADSRAQARQVVRHGHILVNKHKVDIPSYLMNPGDVVEWRGSSVKTEYYKKVAEEIKGRIIPSWLSVDLGKMIGHVLTLPGKDDISARFNGKAVVEYYSR